MLNRYMLWFAAALMAALGVILRLESFITSGFTLMWIGTSVRS